jgi:antitoxin ParD1/3/4
MPKVNVELSQDDLDYLEAELADGCGKSVDDLLTRAIKDYRRARGLEELERLAQEGIDSGEPFEVTPEYWERKKQEFLARRRASTK